MPPPPTALSRLGARLTKLPPSESAQKCPRCESTNTKFCYFNNYSLSQPRHFCKTCRRYWTRGGALRSVPVGGGCRRNKKTKPSTRSKSPVTRGSTSGISTSSCTTADNLGQLPCPLPQFPFLPSLHPINYHYGAPPDIGLSFGGVQAAPVAVTGGGAAGFAEQWRQQQFPFLTGLELPSAGMCQFQSEVKFEENEGLNLPKNLLGNDQYWSYCNAWTDLNGFTS